MIKKDTYIMETIEDVLHILLEEFPNSATLFFDFDADVIEVLSDRKDLEFRFKDDENCISVMEFLSHVLKEKIGIKNIAFN